MKNWCLHRLEENQLKTFMFNHLMYQPLKDAMTPEERVESAKQLEDRRAWYKKYYPDLVK
ncbi:hypothetical protein GZ78_14010 [Endozoicomonas numazuensis]|uniref:Uncharacterized protein n=1 Tax=Endozoicomonas numazuensis TaxID=1137799 RepID=A0A081NJE4_9GAMM|nr:hypothetical protein GZ78_14010 [Endozoicomonas numazuensis]